MPRFVFEGKPEAGDMYRVSGDDENGALLVGGSDVLGVIPEDTVVQGFVLTVDGETVAKGEARAEGGWGYSEYTPMGADKLLINGEDWVEKLMDMVADRERVRIELEWDDGETAP